jgi:hypothetical protein
MSLQVTHPLWLLVLPPVLGWVIWLARTSHVRASAWRRWTAGAVRVTILFAVVLALAGLQIRRMQEGMNVYFLLDRSDSIPAAQQEFSRDYVGRVSTLKRAEDNVGILVFGSEASIESSPLSVVRSDTRIYAVVGGERTDIAAGIRLGTAAFPEVGQKRLVLLSDGQENMGDALAAAAAARSLGVSLDVFPLGATRAGDVSIQRLGMPANVKQGQPFELKIFVEADDPADGRLRLFVNETLLGEQAIQIEAGKNLYTLPQTLVEPGILSVRSAARGGRRRGAAEQSGRWLHECAWRPAVADRVDSIRPRRAIGGGLGVSRPDANPDRHQRVSRHIGGDAELRCDRVVQCGGG